MSNIDLRCGDSYELLKDIPSNSVDLVVIDPPYEFDSDGGGGAFGSKRRNYHEEYLKLYHEETDPVKKEKYRQWARKEIQRNSLKNISCGFDFKILDEFERIMKATNIYIWCSKKQVRKILSYYEDKGHNIDIITWHKTNPIPTCNGTYLNDTEYCIFARAKGVKVYGEYATKRKFYVSMANVADKKLYKHPTIKPLPIIENLITNSSLRGGCVLDCFMGSGTTGVACKKLDRDFIGIELNQEYFEIAKKRIEDTQVDEPQEVKVVEEVKPKIADEQLKGQMNIYDYLN